MNREVHLIESMDATISVTKMEMQSKLMKYTCHRGKPKRLQGRDVNVAVAVNGCDHADDAELAVVAA